MSQTQEILASSFGWIYCFAWSISFLGQIYENYKLRNVEGLKLDFVVYNFTGYFFYSVYNTIGYFSDDPESIGINSVEIQDLVYSYVAECMTYVLIYQCLIYPKGINTISSVCIAISLLCWVFELLWVLLTDITDSYSTSKYLNSVSWLGYIKLFITFIKYTPQVYWNYYRKSTIGWSIFNIICDLLGGIFSLAQALMLQNLFQGLNIAKFCLSIVTLFFDIIFLLQHYVLYKKNSQEKGQSDLISTDHNSLLVNSENILLNYNK